MIKRIVRKVENKILRTGIRSFDEFKKLKQFVQLDLKTLEQNNNKLTPFYSQYVNEVSRPDMAASLELAAFQYTICKMNQYRKVLDMGSGFSSFVFRLYAKETPGVHVFSVDDDEAWLEKTKKFLRQHELETENMIMLNQFLKSNESGFDCILHDLNFVEVRINYLTQIVALIKKSGVIILDDVHKPDYLHEVLVKLKNIKAKTYFLKPVTLDRYGRYSLALIKEQD